MRQLSSCHRDGLISNDMKAQLKSLLLSGLKERVQHAKSILDNQFKPKVRRSYRRAQSSYVHCSVARLFTPRVPHRVVVIASELAVRITNADSGRQICNGRVHVQTGQQHHLN